MNNEIMIYNSLFEAWPTSLQNFYFTFFQCSKHKGECFLFLSFVKGKSGHARARM